jgi:hypothetical protein
VLDGNYYRENVTHKNSMKTSFDVQAYAKHILLKPYLEAELEKFGNPIIYNSIPKLTIDQIALLSVYQGTRITRGNSNDIIKKYGHTSGEKLFQRFTYYSSLANRKGRPTNCTKKTLNNKIELFEKVIKLLPKENCDRANDEIKILKDIFKSDFE